VLSGRRQLDLLWRAANAAADRDRALFERLGLAFEEVEPEGRDTPGACHKTVDAGAARPSA